MGDLMSNLNDVSDDKDVVMLCRSGSRSASATMVLQQQGFDRVYNLKGGIVAWAKEIDQSLPTY